MKRRFTSAYRTFLLALTSMLAVSCSGELTREQALAELASQQEFVNPYYAPIRLGEVVLTGEHFKNSDAYIREHYGLLIDAGLVTVEYASCNSWRAVIDVKLTPQGQAMSDARRSTPKETYVHVCQMVPVRIDEFRVLSEGNAVECVYTFEEQEVTPFGECRGFKEGQTCRDKRMFIYARGKWRLQ